jgi:predicted ArsR family transcriptional regulator
MNDAAASHRRDILLLLQKHGPLTGDDCDMLMRWRIGAGIRRMSELMRLECVERLEDTKATGSGRPAHLHRITDRGLELLRPKGEA